MVKERKCFIFVFMISLTVLCFLYSPVSQAQYWSALPPYNTLWPLWSPALSPVDSATGLPVPIVSELTLSTVLPVQPGLTWDPALDYPWLLYNTPLGMAYYDPIDGVNFWPPPYLVNPMGLPLPLVLPTDYALLPPTDSSWISETVPLGNSAIIPFLSAIPGALKGGVLPTFLIPSAILPLPLPLPPPVPPVVVPAVTAPTVVVPPTIVAPPTVVTPVTSIAVLAPVPTVVVPTPIVPTVITPTTTVIPAVVSGLFFPFI